MKPTFFMFLLSSFFIVNQASALNVDFFNHPEEIHLYNEAQPKAKALKKCALIDTDQYSCLLIESPFIGQGIDQVSVEDIMNRTMASRASYLVTFKNVLKMMPQEALNMFGSVNAVVISERIKPSFYSRTSGAIYISSTYLWKTTEEKELAAIAKDSRDSFGTPFKWSEETNYYKDGKSLYSLNQQQERTDNDVAPFLFKVLFHELTHANDFFPKEFYKSSNLPISKTFSEAAKARIDEGELLSYKTRLSSALLERISEILDFGKEPSDFEVDMDAQYVLKEYIEGEASDLYAYANAREDLAMLIENNLMYYYLNYSSMTVFVKYPTPNFKVPDNYKKPIIGGVKNKIAAPQVMERSQRALSLVFSDEYADKVLEKVGKSKQVIIKKNTTWDKLKNL